MLPFPQAATCAASAILGAAMFRAIQLHDAAGPRKRALLRLVGLDLCAAGLGALSWHASLTRAPALALAAVEAALAGALAGALLALVVALVEAPPPSWLVRPFTPAVAVLVFLSRGSAGSIARPALVAVVVSLGALAIEALRRDARGTLDLGRRRLTFHVQTAIGLGLLTAVLDLARGPGHDGGAASLALAPAGNLLAEAVLLVALLRHRLLGTALRPARALYRVTAFLMVALALLVTGSGSVAVRDVLHIGLLTAAVMVTFLARPARSGGERAPTGLFYRIEREQKELLEELSITLVTELDTDVIARVTARTLGRIMCVREVSVWCIQRPGGPLELRTGMPISSDLPSKLESDHPVIDELRRARGCLHRSSSESAAGDLLAGTEFSCIISLFAKGRVVGLVALGPRQEQAAISAEEHDVLMLVANQVAVAVDHGAIHRDRVVSEKLALIGRMAAGLAHEVRNPLGAIHGAAQLLGEQLPASSRRFVHVIEMETRRLDTLVRKFLAMARTGSVALEPVELSGLLARIVEAHQADPASCRMHVELAGADRPCWVLGEADGLVQIVVNLLVNARDAVDGGGRVWLSLNAGPPPGRVTLTVRDSGPGIAPSIADALFEPFSTTKPAGAGLGLALSRQLAHSMGASLEVGPAGPGAVFHLELVQAAAAVQAA